MALRGFRVVGPQVLGHLPGKAERPGREAAHLGERVRAEATDGCVAVEGGTEIVLEALIKSSRRYDRKLHALN